MSVITFTLIFGFISIFSIIAQYVALWDISPPMVFISLGLVVSALREAITSDIGWTAINREVVLTLAELTLATILVHDASTIKHSTRLAALPLRLLWIGLPLCIVATYFFVNAILPDIGISGALFLAGVLSPTDAGLGAATILNPMVPSLVRQALNVESGLNDGIVTPIVFIALAGLQSGSSGLNLSDVMKFAVIPISLAVAVAVVTGPLYALAIDFSHTHELGNAEGRGLCMAMLPIFITALCTWCGANIFIAAFLAGALFSYFSRLHHEDHSLSELLEAVADMLGYAVWFFAGDFLMTVFKTGFRWQWLVVALGALLPLRMCTVYISLLGSKLDWRSQSFIAWFGPRGLATIVFVLIAVVDISNEQDKEGETHTSSFLDVPINRDLVGAPLFTVLLSVFAHGLSAAPMVKALAAGLAKKRRAGTVAQVQAMDVWDVKNTHIRPRRGYSARYPGPPATTRAAVDAVGSTGAVGDVPRMGAGSLPGDTTSCEELERGLQLGRRSFSQNSLNVHCLDGNLGDLNCDDVEIGTPRSASEKTL